MVGKRNEKQLRNEITRLTREELHKWTAGLEGTKDILCWTL